ncbi:MAG: adenylosuccinate synthase [Planctomycetota bacterium]|nr:MAG: adenylosuccinate synthase [Planctomycetota bacterium]
MRFTNLGQTCVVGLQWGDEGKGKVVDRMVEDFDAVVRYSGGANAGHTVVVGDERFALHQLPSGILHPGKVCMITCGAVVDPAALISEIESLRQRGVDVTGRLRISERAHLVFPHHRKQDALAEQAARPDARLGTTGRGIGPCYADKVSRRWGLRMCDLSHPDRLRERLATIVSHKNAYLNALYDVRDAFDSQRITEEYLAFAEQLRPLITNTTIELHDLIRQGKRVLFEGAQGALLDLDHGTYPYVTSVSTGAGGVCSGAGVPPTTIQSVVGVIKAYCTRVGAGPLPTELHDAVGATIRQRGGEYGTTTGRPRRCGWFDAVAARYAAVVSGPTQLALLHLDTLSGLDEVKICVGYRCGASAVNVFPADTHTLESATPILETLPGWDAEIADCRRFDDLPDAARGYVRRISELLGAAVRMIGVGPARDQVIFVDE